MITKIKPHPCLDNLIDYYWVEKDDNCGDIVLPDGSSCIVFNLGTPIGFTDSAGKTKTISGEFVIGAQKRFFVLEKKTGTFFIGVKFMQGEAYHFFNTPMVKLTDKAFELSKIRSLETKSLLEVLEKAESHDEIRKILNYFFFINVEALICNSKVVDSIIHRVKESKSALLIKDLCESEKISNKHLISLFNKKVGLSPKLLYRINKFKKVIDLLQGNKKVNWTEVAYECNYYDQAHLINEFKRFSGLSPTEYLENENAIDLRVKL